MKVGLMPLDERPVNTRYPQMIAAIARVEVLLPPPSLLSRIRQPADVDLLFAWLRERAADCDHLILSVETLAYGGLIASRTTLDTSSTILARLDRIAELAGQMPIYAFNVITRIPDADDAIEEPLYWGQHGRHLHRYSQRIHQVETDASVSGDLHQLRSQIPDDAVQDFAARRLRNHITNLQMLQIAAGGALRLLVLSSDDTSEYGMGSQEKAWLRTWIRRFELDESRLLMYPGADEVGCVLLMRALLNNTGQPVPTFAVHYAIEADNQRIAPYEDSPIAVTVERQIRALGGRLTEKPDAADFIVAVNTPSRIDQEYDAAHPGFATEHMRRAPFLDAFVAQIGGWLEAKRPVILCDVAYPNGSDPDLVERLLRTVDVSALTAYGAWNTAGNTIGTALAQGVAASQAVSPSAQEAQQRFLLHRFIEDWGYQHIVRQQIRDALEAETGLRDATPTNEAEVAARIHSALTVLLPRLGSLSRGWRIVRLTLPWQRTFEIDFELERA